ncbi:hypothetical protein ACJMK2_009497 [Sinanodonta woodiana]|uniref:RRM domain-containing protein n=1 Tax=Sinanodonta woodiana TaxID=1069815 RepID=A0ABD3VFH2_SINWO
MMHPRGPIPGHMRPPGIPVPSPLGPIPRPGFNVAPVAKVGNDTNNPAGIHTRVFVGNLNTFSLNKEAVESIFRRYGPITAISMHKGYAFVQFQFVHHARSATSGEDGKVYAGQRLDVNMAAEPKNRTGQKRAAPGNSSVNNQDSQVVLICRSQSNVQQVRQSAGVSSGPPAKKQRSDTINQSMKRTLVTLSGNNNTSSSSSSSAAKSASQSSMSSNSQASSAISTLDVLICGNCRSSFNSLHSLAQHKKIPCRLRFTCQCQSLPPPESSEPTEYECASCDAKFSSAWSLCQHNNEEHQITIYKTEESAHNELKTEEVNGEEEN